MATNLPSLFFYSIFRTTPEVSSKIHFVEICYVSEELYLFNHKRADFWLPNFGFKRSLLSLLKGKGAKANNKDNYRGITLFPTLCKIYEMVLLNRLENYAE